MGGLGEILGGGVVGLVTPAYGWTMSVQQAVTDPQADMTLPYSVMVLGGIVGLGLLVDGVRRFVTSDRRYLRMSITTLQEDEKTQARAQELISLFKK